MGRGSSGSDEESSGSESEEDESELSGGARDFFIKKHRCTDPICCFAFIVALVCFAYVFAWGMANGNMDKLSHGLDREGRICGVSPGMEKTPFLYFCPSTWSAANLSSLALDSRDPICVPSCPEGPPNVTEFSLNCTTSTPYATTNVADWYCLPSKSKFTAATAQLEQGMENLTNEFSGGMYGLNNSWPVMVAIVIFATCLGYIYLCLLRAIAKGLIWLCLFIGVAGLVIFGYYLWTQGAADAAELANAPHHEESMNRYSKALAILSWVCAFTLACLVFCCHGEVELSTACVKSGTEVIWKMPLLLLAPLVKAFVKCTLFIIFIVGFIHLGSTAEITGSGTHRSYHFTGTQWLYLAIYAFVGLWILSFVTALYQFSIAYATAKYYETEEEDDGDRHADCLGVLEGVSCGLYYHTGSLALGSALIAALELFQRILQVAKARNRVEGNNPAVSCILGSIVCCCWCIDDVVRFVGKNAYIEIAISSSGFCRAVKNVGHVVLDHGAAMAILNSATVVFQIVGILAITVLCGLLARTMLGSSSYSDPSSSWYVQNTAVSTVVCCALGFIVSWAFMAVFDVATDTLLICMAQDMMQHAGQATHAPANMKQLYEQAQQKVLKKKREEEKLRQQMAG